LFSALQLQRFAPRLRDRARTRARKLFNGTSVDTSAMCVCELSAQAESHEELIITRVAARRMKLLSRRGSQRFIRAIRAANLPKIAGIRVKL